MDANRDDAIRCLEKARAAYYSGDLEKALRLAQKSKRLFPTEKCEGTQGTVSLLLSHVTDEP